MAKKHSNKKKSKKTLKKKLSIEEKREAMEEQFFRIIKTPGCLEKLNINPFKGDFSGDSFYPE